MLKPSQYFGFILLLLSGAQSLSAQPWQRNTLPGPGHFEREFAEGAGWDHTENIIDLSVSFADPDLRAFIDNEWTTVFTEDGVNFKPLRMPHIGTPGCSPMSIEFSRHDASTIYLLLSHAYWRNVVPGASKAGLWRSTDRGDSWEHIYELPDGAYEEHGNNSGGTRIFEDPCLLRSNHIYFGTNSHGLVRSTDGGVSWESIGEQISDRRIKTLSSGTYGDNQTVIYAIAEKKMPVHTAGENIPIDIWQAPSNYSARWKFDKNLNDDSENGNHLSGSISAWNESAAINSYAASFNGSNALAIENMVYDHELSRFTLAAWVKTTDSSDMVIASFDRNEYWELGTRGGSPVWSVLSPVEPGIPSVKDMDTIGFSSPEGYLPGPLADHPDWIGSTGFSVDTVSSGSILQEGLNGWKSLTLSSGLPMEDIYSAGIKFSFNRSTEELDSYRRIFRFGLSDTSSGSYTSLELRRQQFPNDSYALYGVNPGTTNRWPGSATFDESLLGFDDETDSISDELWMSLTYVRGTSLTNWTAYYELWNLTKNTSVAFKVAGEFDVPAEFAAAVLFPHLSSSDLDAVGKVSQRRIYRFDYGSAAADSNGSSSGGRVDEVRGARINDGDWHHVAGVFNGGLLQLYVDGDRVASSSTGRATFGSGNGRCGYLGVGSQSEVYGDQKILSGSGFNGSLDDVRLYNSRAFSQHDVYSTYLESNPKNPVVQGQLWRIMINSAGGVDEVTRLHAPADDFFQLEVNPEDPSRGWFIRKGYPNGYPNGGRELMRFSDFGDSLRASDVDLGGSSSFRDIGINPGNVNHLYLELGGTYRYGMRYSLDGGDTWLGKDRAVGNLIPDFQSWTAHDYLDYQVGFPADSRRENIGQPVSFVPGVPNELLYIIPKSGGLMRSLDYGKTFETYATGGPLKDIGQIAVAPGDHEIWGISVYEQGYSVTKNNGQLWKGAHYENNPDLLDLTSMAEAAGDWWTAARTAGGLAFHPENSDRMIATWTRQAYIVSSADGGMNWSYTGSRSPGLAHMDVYWKAANPDLVYAGRMKSDDAGGSWTDIGKIVISVCESNSDIIVGVDDIFRKVDAGNLGMYVSMDRGMNWVSLPDPPAESVPGLGGANWEVTKFRRTWNCAADALIAIDPDSVHDPTKNDSNRLRILMAGRSGIYEYNAPNSDGSGSESNWLICRTGLEDNPHYSKIEPVPWMGFVLFDPRPGYENIVYAAKQNDIATQGRWSDEINKNHAYPGGNNFEPFYMSMDGGTTWEKMHGADFPDAPESAMIESMTIDSNGRLFAVSTEGIYLISVEGVAYSLFNLEHSNLGHNSVDLSWAVPVDSSCVVAYIVYQDGVRVDSVSGSVFTAGIAGLESSTRYSFNVEAVKGSGKTSAVSNTLTLNTLLPEGPELSLSYSNLGHGSVDLNWVANGNQTWVTAYIVCQDDLPVDTIPASVYTAGISSLVSSTSYDFTVSALDASGHVIAVSNTLSLTTKVIVGPDLSLEFSNIGTNSVDLTWEASGDQSGVAGYIVFRDGLPLDTLAASVFSVTVYGLESGTTYYFTIKAISASEKIIAITEISSVTTLTVSGISPSASQDEEVILLPNPTDGLLYLKNAGSGLLRICAMDGKMVFLQEYHSGQAVNVSYLTRGIYLLELDGERRTRLLLSKE